MITRDYLDVMTQVLTNRIGIKIQEGDRWQADIKNKVLVYKKDDLDELSFQQAKGLLIHETGHIKFTSLGAKTKIEDKYPLSGHDILNAYEDLRIEDLLGQEYRDFARIPLVQLSQAVILDNIAQMRNDFSGLPKLQQFLHLSAMCAYTEIDPHLEYKLGYRTNYIIYKNPPLVKFSPDVIKKIRDNEDSFLDLIHDARVMNSTQNLANLLDSKILPIVKDWLDESEKEMQKQQMADSVKKSMDRAMQALNQLVKSGMGFGGIDDDMQNMKDKPELAETMKKYGSVCHTLNQRIADILKERKASKYSGSHESGRLLSKNVFKILNNESRIFSKKLDNKPGNYRFYFLMDGSGSMTGGNAYYTVQAGQILDMSLRPLGMPLEFYKFTTESYKMKNADEYDSNGGGTDDYQVLSDVLEDMKKYPEDDSIIFEITDGAIDTAAGRKKIIADIKKNRGIIYGIGIGVMCGDNLKYNFENSIQMDDPSKLANELLKIMRLTITR